MKKEQRGSVLVIVFGLSFVVIILAAAALTYVQSKYMLVSHAAQRVSLFYIANAGAQRGANLIRYRAAAEVAYPDEPPSEEFTFENENVGIWIQASGAAFPDQYKVTAVVNRAGTSQVYGTMKAKVVAEVFCPAGQPFIFKSWERPQQ